MIDLLAVLPLLNIIFALVNTGVAIWYFCLIGRVTAVRLALFNVCLHALQRTTDPYTMLTVARLLARDIGDLRRPGKQRSEDHD